MAQVTKLKEYKEEVFIPIYEENIIIIFTNSLVKSLAKLKCRMKDVDKTQGVVISENGENTCVFVYPANLNAIVHETSHLVEDILISRGIKPIGEPRAYLEGYVAEQIDNVQNRAKKAILK